MSYINVVISISDFVLYTEEILKQNNAHLYLEKRDSDKIISNQLFIKSDAESIIKDYHNKNLKFFISTIETENIIQDFYDDDTCQFVIEGDGGRVIENTVERISLRLISKSPDKSIKKVFDSIKNKLKKDDSFGMGVKGNSSIHKNYFYQKKLVGNKILATDIYNEKASLIEI
ncbi:hypothetical protein INQ45_10710 [Flavobacterium columnare]|uniref:hypothetical protein n=1 Tax=Flavobacterium columnare TaxID=996 RepID=UPI002D20D36B|nr:hypothetical protein [Flavobacterium columnare]MEB3801510.1 hypothetical protein [Flavobacterium columnare]